MVESGWMNANFYGWRKAKQGKCQSFVKTDSQCVYCIDESYVHKVITDKDGRETGYMRREEEGRYTAT